MKSGIYHALVRNRLHPDYGTHVTLICPSCLRPVARLEPFVNVRRTDTWPHRSILYRPIRTTEPGSCTCPSAGERLWFVDDELDLTGDQGLGNSGLIRELLTYQSTSVSWKPWTWGLGRWVSKAADRLAAAQAAILHSKLEPALPKEKP